MIICALEIHAEVETPDWSYTVEVCALSTELVRLYIRRWSDITEELPDEQMTVDLTREECRVLGAHLLAIAGGSRGA